MRTGSPVTASLPQMLAQGIMMVYVTQEKTTNPNPNPGAQNQHHAEMSVFHVHI